MSTLATLSQIPLEEVLLGICGSETSSCSWARLLHSAATLGERQHVAHDIPQALSEEQTKDWISVKPLTD
jgi:hypothetical protein